MSIKIAIIGCGFWSSFQTAAWKEFPAEVDVVACCDPDIDKARALATRFDIPHVYGDAKSLFLNHTLDAVDIISDVDSHAPLSRLAADHSVQIICQKPLAPDLKTATEMVSYAASKGVSLYVHENFRWQAPIRRLKQILDQNLIGRPFKGHLKFCSSFPVYDNQPFLAELEQFILTDVGTHILDVARFLFGEASALACQTQRINPKIKGEDVANVFMVMGQGLHCYAEMSYASLWEHESFPETYILVEGEHGSVYLGPHAEISVTTQDGTDRESVKVKWFSWADPEYSWIHSSVYSCNKNILAGLLKNGQVETTGDDNLRTLQLVFDAYESARTCKMMQYP
ncbi:MAG: Gfo/Idh/MocA family oxidoreductase [Saprospiraceae bacterium]|nr:Gfo/Idh/MocA family oxidoreductase [Saprospiraceae bacterium]